MCRSQAEGGRRCNGSGKSSGGGSGGDDYRPAQLGHDDWNHFQPESEATIRERRTGTFNKMFPGPLSEAQRRTFTLRDAGYRGAIDQDGYAVASHPALDALGKL